MRARASVLGYVTEFRVSLLTFPPMHALFNRVRRYGVRVTQLLQ